ncbi:interleukin-12 subunit beta [Larimichthys crocea]|uniref:interleukin-12 subunit beta n=1 Tax=Larimichthys crocea TaxID=215358 RepID=UPI000F5D88D0|nr:interleukin-12 subunit beta [Larimichthys crocea]
MLGEYTCWRGNQKLSSTHLLMEADEGEEFDSLIKCRAKSYDCNFSCKWTNSRYTAVRLGLGPDCSEGGKSCHWVSSGVWQDGGFQLELSHTLSPYTEESTMLELTAEAISDHQIIRRTKRFYLRDIVQPDSPQIVNCQEVEQDLNVTIDPPSSWSTPHSFFSLEHEIEYTLKDDGETRRSLSALIPKRISKLRVRSRDSLVQSTWSQWTPWKNAVTDSLT